MIFTVQVYLACVLTPRTRMFAAAAALAAVVLVCGGPAALAHVALSFGPLLAIVALAWDGRYRGERALLALGRRACARTVFARRRARSAAPRPRAAAAPPSRGRGAPRAVRGPPLLNVVTA